MSTRERPTQRSACDRCHSQKLRCIRGTLPNNSCQRCIKAREPCHSSPPLRVGRRANRLEIGNTPGVDSVTSSSQNESATSTDSSARHLEDEAPINFPQLGFYGGDIALPIHDEALGSCSNPESLDFTVDDYNIQLTQDWTYNLDSHTISSADISNSVRENSWKNLSIDTSLAKPPVEIEPSVQPCAADHLQRQLTELLGSLYADQHHSPLSSALNNTSDLNLHLMDVTVKAAHTLLNAIDSVQVSETKTTPSKSRSFSDTSARTRTSVDAETGFLIAACYSRIFRNSSALATGLFNAVSSNDMSALCMMPSINIGSVTPSYTTSPVIQSALWVQLLWQSVRELEKRLLTFSNPALLSPSTSEHSIRPANKSHLHDFVKALDADVAELELNVDRLLQTTLHTLHHKSI